MPAGQLRESIAVLTPAAPVADGQGGFRPGIGTGTEKSIYARVLTLKGTALLALGAVAGQQLYTITIRANGPVAVGVNTRLLWRGVTLTVTSVAPGEGRDYLTLTASDNGRN